MTFEAKLIEVVQELVARVNELSGHTVGDAAEVIATPSEFPHLRLDHVIAECAGYLEGAADALDVTVLELLDEHGIRTETWE